MKRFWLLILCCACLLPGAVMAQQPGRASSEELFFKANQAYKDGHYQAAVKGYQELASRGGGGGHLFYNLGNSYYRLGELGRAILNYERARLLIPRDADLNFNLNQARDQTIDQAAESPGLLAQGFFWLDNLNLHEVFGAFVVVNALFFGFLALRLFRRPEWTWYVLIVFAIFAALGVASLGVKWHQVAGDDRAVIVAKQAKVLAGPDPGDTLIYRVHQGAVVHFERAENNWILVSIGQDKRGWVRSGEVEKIRLDPLPKKVES